MTQVLYPIRLLLLLVPFAAMANAWRRFTPTMNLPDKKNVAYMALSGAALALLAWLLSVILR